MLICVNGWLMEPEYLFHSPHNSILPSSPKSDQQEKYLNNHINMISYININHINNWPLIIILKAENGYSFLLLLGSRLFIKILLKNHSGDDQLAFIALNVLPFHMCHCDVVLFFFKRLYTALFLVPNYVFGKFFAAQNQQTDTANKPC